MEVPKCNALISKIKFIVTWHRLGMSEFTHKQTLKRNVSFSGNFVELRCNHFGRIVTKFRPIKSLCDMHGAKKNRSGIIGCNRRFLLTHLYKCRIDYGPATAWPPLCT